MTTEHKPVIDRADEIKASLDRFGFTPPLKLSGIQHIEDVYSQYQTLRSRPYNRHIDNHAVQAVFSDRNLLQYVTALVGNNPTLWLSTFFARDPDISVNGIGWHHDKHFQSGDLELDFDEIGTHYSVLIALCDMTVFNGALELIPGTHRNMAGLIRDTRPIHKRPPSDHILNIPDKIETSRVQLELRAGEFIIFHSALLHRSLPYYSGNPRVSMVCRLVLNNVKIPGHILNQQTCVKLKHLRQNK